jgi:hypothetical protein
MNLLQRLREPLEMDSHCSCALHAEAADALEKAKELIDRAEPNGSLIGWGMWWDDVQQWRNKLE